ncbi:MAG: TIGR03016 family PEP-CTERM system-associated outer membrane protein [Gammaproteobacteria bacterium]
MFLTITSISHAGPWQINPSVEVRTGYSDNVEFDDSDDEDSGFIGEINPGLSIVKNEGRLLVNLDYLMQNFYYFDDSDLNTDHTLDSVARYEIIPKTFFLNGYANISKVLIDSTQGISVDNINDTDNTTDERTLGVEPVWIQNLGGYAQANLAYLYAVQDFEDESDEDGVGGDIDNNDRQRFIAALQNRNVDSDRLDWTLQHSDEKIDFDDGEDFDFSSQEIDLGYDINTQLKIVGSYGYENNDFGDIVSIDEDEDGTYWDAGFVYGFGEYTALEVRRGERFFGKTWEANLTVGGPKLAVNASYEETVSLDVLDSISSDGLFSPEQDLLQNDVDTDAANDRDSVSVSETWDATIAYTVSKSTIALNFTDSDSEFLDSNDTDNYEAYALGWLWNITGLSSLFTAVEWQENKSTDLGIEETNDLFDFEIVYSRQLSAKTTFDANYIYSEGNSDLNDDEDFKSNTVSIGLTHNF